MSKLGIFSSVKTLTILRYFETFASILKHVNISGRYVKLSDQKSKKLFMIFFEYRGKFYLEIARILILGILFQD